MAERQFCVTCAHRSVLAADLHGSCTFCQGQDPPPPHILVHNNNKARIQRKVYTRTRVMRPVSFLRSSSENVSLQQFLSWITGDEAHWHQLATRKRGNVTTLVYSITDWGALSRLFALHIPASRRPEEFRGRARGNLIAFMDGTLGVLPPPVKVTHKTEKYGDTVEESVHLQYHLATVTAVGAIDGEVGFSANFPLRTDEPQHWPVTPDYNHAGVYTLRNLRAMFAENAEPVTGLDPMIIEALSV